MSQASTNEIPPSLRSENRGDEEEGREGDWEEGREGDAACYFDKLRDLISMKLVGPEESAACSLLHDGRGI